MLKNYLLIAWRNLRKQKFYAFLNIAGLTLGFTCCLLIGLYIMDATSYDSFHEKADRIMLLQQWEGRSGSGNGFALRLKEQISHIEKTVRLTPANALLSTPTAAYYEPHFYFADSTVFDVFTFSFLQGSAATALQSPYGLVISRRMATKYFPGKNPVGQTLKFSNQYTLNITGVIDDLPTNSHMTVDFLCNYVHARELAGFARESYWEFPGATYVLLSKGTTRAEAEARFPDFVKNTGDQNAGVWKLALIPLRDIYLHAKLDGQVKAGRAIEYVYIFGAVGLFILVLACFNYINLALARSSKRGKEVGVRKVSGATRSQLVAQFLAESTLFIVISVVLAMILIQLLLPFFNSLAEKNLSPALLYAPSRLVWLLLAVLLLSLVTGAYPALALSSFKPITVLKSDVVKGVSSAVFRKVLVVMQFAISVIMIVATIVVWRQLEYINNKTLGYNQEQVLTISFRDVPENLKETFKKEVETMAAVQSATICTGLPGTGEARGDKLVSEFVPQGAANSGMMHINTDPGFAATFGIPLKAGRNFDKNRAADIGAFLVNEAAMKYFGWEDIAGKQVGYYTYQYTPEGGYKEVPVTGEVIGVLADYHHADLKSLIVPMIFSYNTNWANKMAVKINARAPLRQSVQAVEQKWNTLFPVQPFEYQFLDDTFQRAYTAEIKTGQVFSLFAILAIVISCLGLFGLAAYTAEQRTKEIGIRKVLGASATSITSLLSRDFLVLVVLANIIAWPVAWYGMSRWLENFAYHTELSVWIFLASGIAALAVALFTVSYQSVKAATVNPVKSLRSE
jgi:putative ABC transport system permease protein